MSVDDDGVYKKDESNEQNEGRNGMNKQKKGTLEFLEKEAPFNKERNIPCENEPLSYYSLGSD